MEREPNNTNCALFGSPHCALLNCESCEKCHIAKLSREEQLEAMEDIFYIAEALPENGVEDIMDAETCALCRAREDEEAEEATRYAQITMGHEHPTVSADEKPKGKYDRATAMTIPVQLPVCDECRKRLNLYYYLPLALGILVALVGLVLTSIEAVRIPLTRYGRALPFLVFLIFVFLGIIIESTAKRILKIRIERSMNTRAKRIPALSELVKNGWFPIGDRDGMLPFNFTADPLENGLLTGEGQNELLRKIRVIGKEGIPLFVENAAAGNGPKEETAEPEKKEPEDAETEETKEPEPEAAPQSDSNA